MISLYKAYVLPHLEYCCPLLLGISKALKNHIERTNHYAIKTLLNLGNLATYDFCPAMADMDTLEQRRTLQSLIQMLCEKYNLQSERTFETSCIYIKYACNLKFTN